MVYSNTILEAQTKKWVYLLDWNSPRMWRPLASFCRLLSRTASRLGTEGRPTLKILRRLPTSAWGPCLRTCKSHSRRWPESPTRARKRLNYIKWWIKELMVSRKSLQHLLQTWKLVFCLSHPANQSYEECSQKKPRSMKISEEMP